MSSDQPRPGLDGLVAGLGAYGADPFTAEEVLQFTVVPAAGAYAGTPVSVGVGLDEVGTWPLLPPHWIHLPESVIFPATNSQPSTVPGWLKHSRNIQNWGDAVDPAQAFLAHVRAVLGDAL